MTPDLLAKYARPVPRYTSYPTALQFTPEVDAAVYRRWLGGLDPGQALSLYVHVPFCERLCWFCGCHTTIVNRYGPVADYLGVLAREIDLVAEMIGAPGPVTHVHFGGGSPSIVAAQDFGRLMDLLRRRFAIAGDAEIAVEIDPRTATAEVVAGLAAAGTTRASLGIQDFDPAVQRAVNRVQPFDLTAKVVERLRRAGIERINFDLMYGLPRQRVEGLLATVGKAISLAPDRVAVFGYAHVPWMKRHQRLIDEARLPGALDRWRQMAAVAARLRAAGYVAVGFDHFARPDDAMAKALEAGTLHRDFQGYGPDKTGALLAFGASAISSLPGGDAQNAPGIPEYRGAIGEGRAATVRGVAIGEDDRLRRDIIERLMCELAVDLDAACRRRGQDAGQFGAELAALAPMREDGLVEIEGHRVTVTEAGRPLVRRVCAVFDRYFVEGEGRHSPAV